MVKKCRGGGVGFSRHPNFPIRKARGFTDAHTMVTTIFGGFVIAFHPPLMDLTPELAQRSLMEGIEPRGGVGDLDSKTPNSCRAAVSDDGTPGPRILGVFPRMLLPSSPVNLAGRGR